MVVAVARSLGPAEFGDYLIGITDCDNCVITCHVRRNHRTRPNARDPSSAWPTGKSSSCTTLRAASNGRSERVCRICDLRSILKRRKCLLQRCRRPGGSAVYYVVRRRDPALGYDDGASVRPPGFGRRFPYVACENIGRPLLQFVLTLVALLAGGGATSIAAAWMVPFIVEAFVVVVWFRTWWRRVVAPNRVRSVRTVRTQVIREYWAFTGPQAAGEAVRVVTQRMDVLLLGALSTTAAAGVYGAAMRYVAGAGMILGAITIVIGPRLSEILAIHNYPSAEQALPASHCGGLFARAADLRRASLLRTPRDEDLRARVCVRCGDIIGPLAAATCASLAAGPVLYYWYWPLLGSLG